MNGIDSWKVVLYLLPVALAMLWVRRREAAVGVTQFHELDAAQKAWILLVALPPGAAALLMGLLTEEQIRGYVQVGSRIGGSGQNLVPGVVRQFVSLLPPDWVRGAGRDLDELLGLLTRRAQSDPSVVVRCLVANWPPPEVPASPLAVPATSMPFARFWTAGATVPLPEAEAEAPAEPAPEAAEPTEPSGPREEPEHHLPRLDPDDAPAEEPPARQGEDRPPDVHP